MFEALKNRRTIRKYQQKDISSDLLNDLLEASFRASTMGGMQLYSVIVTRETGMKERLSPAHFNQPMIKGAPVVLSLGLLRFPYFVLRRAQCRRSTFQLRFDDGKEG